MPLLQDTQYTSGSPFLLSSNNAIQLPNNASELGLFINGAILGTLLDSFQISIGFTWNNENGASIATAISTGTGYETVLKYRTRSPYYVTTQVVASATWVLGGGNVMVLSDADVSIWDIWFDINVFN